MTNDETVVLDGITGTMVWYYYICKREVWLISRQIVADQQDENLDWGRYLHEHAYVREKKEIAWESVKIDTLSTKQGETFIAEIKKSSSYLKSAKMQMMFYLYRMKLAGVEVKGELRFPEERKREMAELDESAKTEILTAIHQIKNIISLDKPPAAEKIKYCGKCAYREFCWA